MRTSIKPKISLLLALVLSACGQAQRTQDDLAQSGAHEPLAAQDIDSEQGAVVSTRVRPLPIRLDAWPLAAEGAEDAITDGVLDDEGFVTEAGLRFPWSLVFRVADGPQDLAALVFATRDDPRQAREVTVLSHLGEMPLTNNSYPEFIEGSERHGSVALPKRDELLLVTFETPVPAHFFWMRVQSNHGGDTTSFPEVYALDSANLQRLMRSDSTTHFETATLSEINASAWSGQNLMGFPVLGDNGEFELSESQAEEAAQQVEAREDEDDQGSRPQEPTSLPQTPSTEDELEEPSTDR